MQEKTCFVIMPFGDKQDVDGTLIEFDKVYKFIIVKAIARLKEFGYFVKCVRCDEIGESGWIHSKMIEHIWEADIALVDLTTSNPNVFYELGVRHTLRDKVTVLIRKRGTKLPFNIQGLSVIDYDFDMEMVEQATQAIANCIYRSLESTESDSLVYQVLDNLRIERGSDTTNLIIQKKEIFNYRLKQAQGKQISIVTGDLSNIRGVDVWVNAENTNMQMARFYDRSMSGIVRYYGSRRNAAGHIIEDVIADELKTIMGNGVSAIPGQVIPTGSGQLASRGVKRILHAAAVEGKKVGEGYRAIADPSECVRNALELVDGELFEEGLKSILFPILGTGAGGGGVKEIVGNLLLTTIHYLENHPDSCIDNVFFLAQRRDQRDACLAILANHSDIEVVQSAS